MIVIVRRSIAICGLFLAAILFGGSLVGAQEEKVSAEVTSAVENSGPYDQAGKVAPIASAAPVGAQPSLKMLTTKYEAGTVDPGSTINYDFIVENLGDADLEIISVEPGCGCSVANFDKIIKPGEKGKVAISVEIYPQWAGDHFNKQAMMVTNDVVKKHTILTITGDVAMTPSNKKNESTEKNN